MSANNGNNRSPTNSENDERYLGMSLHKKLEQQQSTMNTAKLSGVRHPAIDWDAIAETHNATSSQKPLLQPPPPRPRVPTPSTGSSAGAAKISFIKQVPLQPYVRRPPSTATTTTTTTTTTPPSPKPLPVQQEAVSLVDDDDEVVAPMETAAAQTEPAASTPSSSPPLSNGVQVKSPVAVVVAAEPDQSPAGKRAVPGVINFDTVFASKPAASKPAASKPAASKALKMFLDTEATLDDKPTGDNDDDDDEDGSAGHSEHVSIDPTKDEGESLSERSPTPAVALGQLRAAQSLQAMEEDEQLETLLMQRFAPKQAAAAAAAAAAAPKSKPKPKAKPKQKKATSGAETLATLDGPVGELANALEHSAGGRRILLSVVTSVLAQTGQAEIDRILCIESKKPSSSKLHPLSRAISEEQRCHEEKFAEILWQVADAAQHSHNLARATLLCAMVRCSKAYVIGSIDDVQKFVYWRSIVGDTNRVAGLLAYANNEKRVTSRAAARARQAEQATWVCTLPSSALRHATASAAHYVGLNTPYAAAPPKLPEAAEAEPVAKATEEKAELEDDDTQPSAVRKKRRRCQTEPIDETTTTTFWMAYNPASGEIVASHAAAHVYSLEAQLQLLGESALELTPSAGLVKLLRMRDSLMNDPFRAKQMFDKLASFTLRAPDNFVATQLLVAAQLKSGASRAAWLGEAKAALKSGGGAKKILGLAECVDEKHGRPLVFAIVHVLSDFLRARGMARGSSNSAAVAPRRVSVIDTASGELVSRPVLLGVNQLLQQHSFAPSLEFAAIFTELFALYCDEIGFGRLDKAEAADSSSPSDVERFEAARIDYEERSEMAKMMSLIGTDAFEENESVHDTLAELMLAIVHVLFPPRAF